MNWVSELDKIFDRNTASLPIVANTPQWWTARRGRLTASGAAHVIAPFKGRGVISLMGKLREQLSPDYERKPELSLPGLDWGRKYERAALSSLELQMGIDIVEPGTMFHPRYSYCSATPDAVFESEIGLISVQVKCPHNGQIHLDSLYNKPILQVGPKGGRRKYWYQVQWEMWVSGAVAALFVSFDPEQPAATKLAVCDIFRDDKMMRTFEHNSLKFRNLFETGLSLSTGTATPIGIPD